MKPYELLVSYRVIELIDGLPRKAQLAIRRRFVGIRDYPFHHSDYAEFDPTGRRLEINILGAFAIKYWIDDADAQIKILELNSADLKK